MVTLDEGGYGAEWRTVLPPPERLADIVELSSIQEHPAHVRKPGRAWRIVPDPAPHLILHVPVPGGASTAEPRLRLVGPRTVHVDSPRGRKGRTVAVRMRPGALPLLTGLPASDFTDRGIPVEDVLGSIGRRLRERVHEADSAGAELAAMLDAVSEATAGRRREWRARRVSELVLGAQGRVRVGAVAAGTGMSPRTLRNVVAAEIGLTPKRMVRIVRLFGALTRAQRHPGSSWAGLAVASGYYDQAHLINDARALLGETPEAFRSRGGEARPSRGAVSSNPRGPDHSTLGDSDHCI